MEEVPISDVIQWCDKVLYKTWRTWFWHELSPKIRSFVVALVNCYIFQLRGQLGATTLTLQLHEIGNVIDSSWNVINSNMRENQWHSTNTFFSEYHTCRPIKKMILMRVQPRHSKTD